MFESVEALDLQWGDMPPGACNVSLNMLSTGPLKRASSFCFKMMIKIITMISLVFFA